MRPASVVESYLSAQEIPHERSGEATWSLHLRGERKHAIPVSLTIRERTLLIESFFMRRPIDAAAEFYRMLLARNMRPSRLRFAADADGDVYVVGEVALDSLDEAVLDGVLGELLYTADQMFDAAIVTGFSSYLERDRAWRAGRPEGEGETPPETK